VNAAELFASLGARPADGVQIVAKVGGVEVALARDGSERGLRRAWRDLRHGAVPLLVIHDAPQGTGLVHVIGPADDQGAVRTVAGERIVSLLRQVSGERVLAAARQLSEELARLDESGVPGLVVKGLLTRHFLIERLRKLPEWQHFRELAESLPAAADWRTLLLALGYRVEQRKLGYLLRAAGAPALVVLPVADPGAFARLDEEGRPPEGVLSLECHAEGVPYGILASGSRLRLFRSGVVADPGAPAATTSYLELDASELRPEDRPLLALFSPETLAPDGLFVRFLEQSRRFGAELRERLDDVIRASVLPGLARGLAGWLARSGEEPTAPRRRRELQDACLAWVFRALFVLYAESSGYLPVDALGYRANALSTLAEEAAERLDSLDPAATSLWDRFAVLVRTLRTGNVAMDVPAYNGDLFAAAALPGAALLERASIPDATFGPVLAVLGRDPETGGGVDYSSLAVAHLGNIYEGLLALQLTVADADLGLYAQGSGPRREWRYERARRPADVEVHAGELFWQTHTGGRKAGGVYYTPELLVDHLVVRAVLPSLEKHLEEIAEIAASDPQRAARELLGFRVLDPACGSAHFLVAALHRIAERMDRFLAQTPLPAIRDELESLRTAAGSGYGARVEHGDLLHRLILKRCIYGVDLSPMGAEVARLSLWLAAFVPGLSLAYLGHNVQPGDSLVGVADQRVLVPRDAVGSPSLDASAVEEAVADAALKAAELAEIADRTPAEWAHSQEVDRRLHQATTGVRRLFDTWTAGVLGSAQARQLATTTPVELIEGSVSPPDQVAVIISEANPLHWLLAFPEAFTGSERGFDVVVGNPPWEEVTVEDLAFYARYYPGLRGLPAGPRETELSGIRAERPELAEELRVEQERLALLRRFLGPAGGYTGTAGDPDLYKSFCQRYRVLLRPGGRLGVVLPRSTFLTAGSRRFREWLFGHSTVERLDFLVNNRLWMFPTHPQYTVALLVAAARAPDPDHEVEVAGVANSAIAFASQSARPGVRLPRSAMGTGDVVPLLPSQGAQPVLATMRHHREFPYGGGRWRCFPVAEFHETADRRLWEGARRGWALWKGESFDQHDPHGAEARICPPSPAALKKARKPRPGAESMLAREVTLADRRAAVAAEVGQVRLAFRDVSRATDSRTVRASLVPAETFLTNKAPYLAFVDGGHRERVACCAVMNSLPFDWQARRFVETNLNFFILELLTVPAFTDSAYDTLVKLGARLSCPDERFAEVAAACGITSGVLAADERAELRGEVDALVTVAYGLGTADADILLDDFTLDAVSPLHRDAFRRELDRLC
jgi:hypothetical protein